MRYLKSLLLFFMIMSLLLVTVMIIAVTGGYFYLHHLKPQYAGEVTFIAVGNDVALVGWSGCTGMPFCSSGKSSTTASTKP